MAGRPPTFSDGSYVRVSLGISATTRAKLEEATVLLAAKVGRRLSMGQAVEILLEESETLRQMSKATAKARAEK